MSASYPAFRIDITYVFSGRLEKVDPNGVRVWAKGSLRPVQGKVMYTSDVGCDAGAGDLQAWCTDGKGLLRPLRDGGAVHSFARTRRFIVPPSSVLLQAWVANPKEAPELLAQLIASSGKDAGIELTKQRIEKAQLSPPDNERAKTDPDEKAYAEFYNGRASTAPIFAYVLARTRAVLLKVTLPSLKGATITLCRPDGKELKRVLVKATRAGLAAVYYGEEKELPPGMYRIVVKPVELRGRWSSAVKNEYELKARLRFHIENDAGQFEIVDCDPITVQEAVLLQFSALYARLLAAAQGENVPAASFDVSVKERPQEGLPPALKAWGERIGWAKGHADLAVKAASGDLTARKLAMHVIDHFEAPDDATKAAIDALKLFNNFADVQSDWHDLRVKLRVAKQLKNAEPIVFANVKGFFKQRVFINYLAENKDIDLVKFSNTEKDLFFRAGIVKQRSGLEAVFASEKRVAKNALTALDIGLKGYDTVQAGLDLMESWQKKEDTIKNFAELAGKVESELGGVPCKEAIGNLERRRQLTIAAALEVDEKEVRAVLAALDLALAVASAIVGGPLLEAVVVIRDTWQLVCAATEWVDRYALRGLVSATYERWNQINKLLNASDKNQELLRKSKDKPTEVQFRLRAEAIAGLVGLITRASVASKDEGEYLDRVKKYHIDQYIQTYLLSDGWQIPLRAAVPISMDAYWLYATGKHGPLIGIDPMRFTQPKTLANGPGGVVGFIFMAFADALVAGHVRAEFQKTFPIHHLDSETVELAKALRTYWGEVRNEDIAYQCVYTRNFMSQEDADWTLVDAHGAKSMDELPRLTPLSAIRVLIVMKETVKPGIYPISLQVVRVDPLINIKGPIYRGTLRPLKEELLPNEREKFAGRVGCVLYPFYQFIDRVYPGLKPLNRLVIREPNLLWHGMRKMRYSLAVRAGCDTLDSWVNLGTSSWGVSQHDELNVAFANTPVEELMARDVAFLTREGEKFAYPHLFGSLTRGGPLYVRVGDAGPYRCALAREGGAVNLASYDWKSPVELIVVVWARNLFFREWERQGLDWKSIPMAFNLARGTGGSAEPGPEYNGTFHHVGEMTGLPDLSLKLDPAVEKTDVKDWAHQVSGATELYRLGETLYGERSVHFHLFAARVPLDYILPNGKQHFGLRPFGSMPTQGSLSYVVANVRSVEDSGLYLENIRWETLGGAPWSITVPVPGSYTVGMPWTEGLSPDKAHARIERWITREGAARDASNEPTAE